MLAAVAEGRCQGLLGSLGTPPLVQGVEEPHGEGSGSPSSPEGLEGPLRPQRRAGSDLTAWVTGGGRGSSCLHPTPFGVRQDVSHQYFPLECCCFGNSNSLNWDCFRGASSRALVQSKPPPFSGWVLSFSLTCSSRPASLCSTSPVLFTRSKSSSSASTSTLEGQRGEEPPRQPLLHQSRLLPAQVTGGQKDVPVSGVRVPLRNVSDLLLRVLLLLALPVLQVALLQVHLPREEGSFFVLLQLLFCQGKGMAVPSGPRASQTWVPQPGRQASSPGVGCCAPGKGWRGGAGPH